MGILCFIKSLVDYQKSVMEETAEPERHDSTNDSTNQPESPKSENSNFNTEEIQ